MRPRSANARSSSASLRPQFVSWLLVLATSSQLVLAAPDTPSKDNHDRAQAAYQEALKLYKAGQYRAAVDKLITARKLDPTAEELPYNLGLLYEKLGDLDNAIKNFEIYLALEKDPAERERVQSIVERLKGARSEVPRPTATASASASSPPPPPPSATASPTSDPTETPPPTRRGRLDAAVYATGGLAVVAAAAGTFFGIRALTRRPSDTTTSPVNTAQSIQEQQDKAHQSAVIADISFGVAVAAGGASVLLYLLRDAPTEPSSSAFVAPVTGGAIGGWGLRF